MRLYELNNPGGPAQQWLVSGSGVYQPCGQTVHQLPAGAYACTRDCYGNILFVTKPLFVDDLIDFTDSLPDRVLAEVRRFWELAAR